MWSEFHFIEPLWFLALLPLGLLLWLAWRADAGASAWRKVVDARLLGALRVGGDGQARRLPLALLAAAWLIAVAALANPTLERKPVPAFRADAARVVVLDLSRSMLADDLTPSRLERARYKVADILARSADGQVGLVAFAGDAFAVSPLTDDADTILAMLEALSPDVMPVQGSRPDLGIESGLELLQQAGARHGQVVLLTDDAGGARALAAAESLRDAGHVLGVIGAGTADGAPVPGVSTSAGPVIAKLDVKALQKLARAGGGRYAGLAAGDADLAQVLIDPATRPRALSVDDPMLAQAWKELGPWITLALLPLGALAFRRGWLAVVLVLTMPALMGTPEPAMALGWDDLWSRPEQQAAAALASGDYERARDLAQSPARAGSASYRLGDYAAAAERFAAGETASDHYNRGNALAQAGNLEEALAAYDEALALDPESDDTRYNRAQVEAALRQQQQQQKQQQQEQQKQGQQGDNKQQDQSNAGEGSPEQSQQGQGQDQQEQAQQGAAGSEGGQDQQGQPSDSEQSASANQQAGSDQGGQPDAEQDQPERQGASPTAANEGAGQEQASAAEQDTGGQHPEQQRDGQPESAASGEEAGDATRAELPPADRDAVEQAAEDYREAAAAAQAEAEQSDQTARPGSPGVAEASAEEREARQAADQWLRRIPDDPAGLLRRKFLYQYRNRGNQAADMAAGKPW